VNRKAVGIIVIAVASVGAAFIVTSQSRVPDTNKEFQSIYGMTVLADKSPNPDMLAVKLNKIEAFAKRYPDSPQLSTLISAVFSDSSYTQVSLNTFLETVARFDPYLQHLENRSVSDGAIRSALNHYLETPNLSFSSKNEQTALDLFAHLTSLPEAQDDFESYLSVFAALNHNQAWQLKLIKFAKTLPTQPQNPGIYSLFEFSANQLRKPLALIISDWDTKQTTNILNLKTPHAIVIVRKIPTEPQFAQFLKQATATKTDDDYKIIVHSIDPPSAENSIPANLPRKGIQYSYGMQSPVFKLFPHEFQGVVLYTDGDSNYIGYDQGQRLLHKPSNQITGQTHL
jgi:hypothetical protein